MTMGILAVAGSRRSILQTSKPSTSGNIKSSTMRLGKAEWAFLRASAPSAAVTTSKPAGLRLYSTSSTASGSSSTTRIFGLTPPLLTCGVGRDNAVFVTTKLQQGHGTETLATISTQRAFLERSFDV